ALHSTDRAHLLDDAFSLAEAGLLNYETAMEMTRYLKNESDYVPWQVAANKFNGLGKLLVSSTFYAKYRKYLACLMSSVYHKVTMVVSEDDPHLTRLLRPTIAQLACRVGVQECVNETIEMFKNWINNVKTAEKPHPDIRSHVYGQGLKLAGGEREWDIMWNLYLNETDAQERIKLLSGLAHSSEPWILKRLLSKNLKVRIYKTATGILLVVLYGCETWTLTLREEQRLRVFENKVLRKIFGAKRGEVTGEWRKLHNTELHALYSSPDIIRNIKSRRLRWAGHVARMGKFRTAYRVYIELSKNETNVRSQDYFTVLSFISHNPVGTPIVWDFISIAYMKQQVKVGVGEEMSEGCEIAKRIRQGCPLSLILFNITWRI
ncbi:hypothetical protein ANN_14193, partial [Periplaneta americana]